MFIEMNPLHVSMCYKESSDRYERGHIDCFMTLNLVSATFSYTKSNSFQFNK